MKSKLHISLSSLGLHSLLFTLAVAGFSSQSAKAASGSWTGLGADSLWSTTLNWNGATPPGTGGQTATFNGTGNAKTTIDLNTGVPVSNIVFDTASAAAYTIGAGAAGSQNLTLNSNITMNSTVVNNQLFNSNVLLNGATNTLTNNSTTNTLTIAGGISSNTAGAKTLAIAGAGITAISGNITAGPGTVGISKSGAGTLSLSGTNALIGYTSSSGTLQISGGSTTVDTAMAYSATGTHIAVTSGTLTASAGFTSSGNSTARSLNLNGGTLQSGGNVFASALATNVTFNGGTLQSGAAITIYDADNTVDVNSGGATIDTTGGNITAGTNSSSVNTVKINGSAAGAITVKGGNTFVSGITNTGLLTLQDSSTWNTNGVASSVAGIFGTNGTITNTGSASTLTTNFTGSQTFGGIISGASNLSLTKSGVGTQILTGSNTYTGTTTISTGTLQLGSGSTTGSLSASSSITNNGTFAVNRSNAVTQGTDFGIIVAGTGGVTQSGAGTLTLNTANTYSGTTQISSGTLVGSASGALGSGTVNNSGKLQVTGGITLNNAISTHGETNANPSDSAGAIESTGTNTLNGNINFGNTGGLITNVISSSGALTIAGNMSTTLGSGRTFNFGGAGDTTVNGSIIDGTSAVSVSKNGAGSLTLAGINSYSGTTSVSAGTLFISGELGISNVSVSTNATIAAGDASGSLGGNLHFASGAILDVSFGILTVGDTATLSFGGFDFTSLVGFDVQSAAIGTYTLIDGDFTLDATNLAYYGIGNAYTRLDGNKAYFDEGSLTVTVAAIPEPSAALLGGLGLLVLLRRRR